MIALSEIKVKYSENKEALMWGRCCTNPHTLATKLNQIDLGEYSRNKLGYDKTGLIIKWVDGFEYELRYDIGDGKSVGERLNHKPFISAVENGLRKCSPDLLKMVKEAQKLLENRELPN